MTPQEAYQYALKYQNFSPDPIQEEAVQLTETLYHQLNLQTSKQFSPSAARNTQSNRKTEHSFYNNRLKPYLKKGQLLALKLLSPVLLQKHQKIKGLYFWGGVGRGKSWIIDSFYNSLTFTNKRRIHFHPFMQAIHEQLKDLPKTPDPLPILAKQMAQEFQLLCIDEFHVQDITDAMLLAGLLEALFSEGVILVTTSNIAPDDLYKNGLQRDSFLPAIKLIQQNTLTFELNNETDYRTLILDKEGCYHLPVNQYNQYMMEQHYIKISQNAPVRIHSIEINKRQIQVFAVNHASNKHPHSIVWFEFDALCNTARSNSDYLSIARQYPTILVSNIYIMGEQKDDVAKRFVHLIDALYDNHCTLVINAEAEPDKLYHGRRLKKSFLRTASRLKEMRSKLYRAKQNTGIQ